jgi:hypothetical protein
VIADTLHQLAGGQLGWSRLRFGERRRQQSTAGDDEISAGNRI